jgi:hypothetical protein
MKEWLIWSNEHDGWWKQHSCGYTKDPRLAELYTYESAMSICEDANLHNKYPVPLECMVHRSNIKELQTTFDKEMLRL